MSTEALDSKCECLYWARTREMMALAHHPRCPAVAGSPAPICTAPPAESVEDAKAFKRVAIELRIRFPVEIQYNSEFEAMVKRLEGAVYERMAS